jgi:alpha-glucosidase
MTVKMVVLKHLLAVSSALLPSVSANILPRQQNATLGSCPGYKASGVKTTANGLTASLTLAGTACNVYGTDLKELTLAVEYQSGKS